MTDKQKTKQELIQELDILRQRVAVLDKSELARKKAEALTASEFGTSATDRDSGAAGAGTNRGVGHDERSIAASLHEAPLGPGG